MDLKKYVLNVGAITAALSTSLLYADGQHLKFNLPFRAHWGDMTLEAGDHAFSVPFTNSWPQTIALEQNGKRVVIAAMTEYGDAESNASYLRLVNVDGSYFVREYYSGPSGKRFTFPTPKPTRQSPDRAIRIRLAQ